MACCGSGARGGQDVCDRTQDLVEPTGLAEESVGVCESWRFVLLAVHLECSL